MHILIPFLVYLAAEISLFVVVGGDIGVLLTIVEVFGTGWLGLTILKTTGSRVSDLARWRRVDMVTVAKIGGARVFAGILFVLPGFLTDALATCVFLLSLIPFVSLWINKTRAIWQGVSHADEAHRRTQNFTSATGQARTTRQTSRAKPSEDVIEGNYTERDSKGADDKLS